MNKIKIRSQFIASPGYTYIACDLSQAEAWIVAFLANERTMKDALLYSDIHTITAAALFITNNCSHPSWRKQDDGLRVCDECGESITEIMRYLGKKSNHGNNYRMSPERWTQVINAESDNPPFVTVMLSEARKYNKRWLDLYVGIKQWWREIERQLRENRTLTTPYGRRRVFYGAWNDSLFKEATAYIPQSTVADHALGCTQSTLGIEGGILAISKLPDIKAHCRIVTSAHDSVLIEVPKGSELELAPQIYNKFCRPLEIKGEVFTIPVDVEIGDRYGELEKLSTRGF